MKPIEYGLASQRYRFGLLLGHATSRNAVPSRLQDKQKHFYA